MKAPPGHGNTYFVMFLRAIAINALAAAVVFLAYREGWIDAVIKADTFYISRAIVALGLLGFLMAIWRILKVSHELNIAHRYYALTREMGPVEANNWLESTGSLVADFALKYRRINSCDKPALIDQLEKKMIRKFSYLITLEDWLVRMGLLGTVVGFRTGLGRIDFGLLKDFDLIGSTLGTLTGYIFIALDTTIVGICMAIWLDVNLKWILRPGMGKLIEETVNIGVSHE